jgi:ornithine cyclodeaminase
MQLLALSHIQKLIQLIGCHDFFLQVIERIETDYHQWDRFEKTARHATHVPGGVIELMPASDDQYYAMKYVNGHPKNTPAGKLCVMAVGLLARVSDGMPLLFSEMTILTAIRTACTSALVAKYSARPDSETLGCIGLGAQIEFQIVAFQCLFPIKTVYLYDIDSAAIDKAVANIQHLGVEVVVVSSAKAVAKEADILITATAAKEHAVLLHREDIKPGTHINAIGGDCPGKTEWDIQEFIEDKILVEYLPQAQIEGEIQRLRDVSSVYALHTVIQRGTSIRENPTEITFFDSVGFALEDYSILRVVYALSQTHKIFASDDYIPTIENPKDLFSLLLE